MILKINNSKKSIKERIAYYLTIRRYLAKRVTSITRYGGRWIVKIRSESDPNKIYEVLVDFDDGVFSCDCKDFLFKNSNEPEVYYGISKRPVWLCKHIIGAIERLRDVSWEADEFIEKLKEELAKQ